MLFQRDGNLLVTLVRVIDVKGLTKGSRCVLKVGGQQQVAQWAGQGDLWDLLDFSFRNEPFDMQIHLRIEKPGKFFGKFFGFSTLAVGDTLIKKLAHDNEVLQSVSASPAGQVQISLRWRYKDPAAAVSAPAAGPAPLKKGKTARKVAPEIVVQAPGGSTSTDADVPNEPRPAAKPQPKANRRSEGATREVATLEHLKAFMAGNSPRQDGVSEAEAQQAVAYSAAQLMSKAEKNPELMQSICEKLCAPRVALARLLARLLAAVASSARPLHAPAASLPAHAPAMPLPTVCLCAVLPQLSSGAPNPELVHACRRRGVDEGAAVYGRRRAHPNQPGAAAPVRQAHV